MKAEELRIGNYHYYTIHDEVDERKLWDEVCTIDAEDILHLYNNPDDPNFKPIPLTEEWLIRMGFVQDNGIMSWRNEDVQIVYETLAKFYRLYPRTDRIEYVHQLQNLFFALTGEELTIQPKTDGK